MASKPRLFSLNDNMKLMWCDT